MVPVHIVLVILEISGLSFYDHPTAQVIIGTFMKISYEMLDLYLSYLLS